MKVVIVVTVEAHPTGSEPHWTRAKSGRLRVEVVENEHRGPKVGIVEKAAKIGSDAAARMLSQM